MSKSLISNLTVNEIRSGIDAESIAKAFLDNLYYTQGVTLINASKNDLYLALSLTVRDRMLSSWNKGLQDIIESKINKDYKIVSYLSAEFLPGPHLANNLVCLGILEETKKAMEILAIDLDELLDQEEEPGLGNGGLGRLASCFLDSLANLSIPAFGYGIRYEFGIFDQDLYDGWQVEITDKWLRYGNPWEIARPELSQEVFLGGHTEGYFDEKGKYRVNWKPGRVIKGIPYDTPILGFVDKNCNTMRLWKAEAIESFDFRDFNLGDYYAAVDEKVASETITKVLYPNDETEAGKQLRLIQQYFFVSCSLKDMIKMHFFRNEEIHTLHQHFAVQMNDTHPSIAVAELMRILIDEYRLEWAEAWNITTNTLAYTNHTLMSEALEKWRLDLFKSVLPRHLEIIYEINHRFLQEVRAQFPGDDNMTYRMSIIDEAGCKYVRMANLACVGSHTINGVAELHSKLLKQYVLNDFYRLWPEKFLNVTNGVTPRRWVAVSNPKLSELISKNIDETWISDYHNNINKIEELVQNKTFRKQWQEVKLQNKTRLATWVKNRTGIVISSNALFDVQVKRLHEYKRQHLNVLHILSLYNRLKDNPKLKIPSRVFLFGGKAAPGYFMAKNIIKLINSVGNVINNDKDINDKLKVVFVPNFNVQIGHLIYPAADLSEQISLAGKEASGTGNMKFSMNGALTIGTLDGANVEIRDQVGAENFFLFGLTSEEVYAQKSSGYHAWDYYHNNEMLRRILDQISFGYYSNGDKDIFKSFVDSLLYRDEYMALADFQPYVDCQDKVSDTYLDIEKWTTMSILNVARMGKFSSDRSILEYAKNIWKTAIK
jgi:starch phosphorylase